MVSVDEKCPPGEGLVLLLLLDLQLRRLQAQRFPGLGLLGAAVAQAAPALLHLGRQPPTAALDWIVAARGTNREERSRGINWGCNNRDLWENQEEAN